MLYSSSAFSLISCAFSEASCWMNLIICGEPGPSHAVRATRGARTEEAVQCGGPGAATSTHLVNLRIDLRLVHG